MNVMKSTVSCQPKRNAFRTMTFSATTLFALLLFARSASAQQTDVDQLFSRAVQAQQSGDYDTAIHDYRELIARGTGMVDAHINLGAALAHVGKFDAAIEQYQLAIPRAADKNGVRLNMGLAYYKKGDFAAACGEFDQLRRQRPEDAQLAILLGDSEVKLGLAAEAASTLLPLEAANAQNPDFEYVLGTAMIASKQRREGAARLEKVAAANNDAGAYLLAGSTQLDLNEYEAAHRDLEEALRLDAKLPRIYSLAGMAREKVSDKAGAEAAFLHALLVDPDDFDANLYLGAILTKRRDMDAARKYLDRAVQLQPQSSMARYELGTWKSADGRYEEAATDLEIVLKGDPTWLEPHIELASVYYHLHREADGAKQRQIVDQLTAQQEDVRPSR